MCIRDRSGGDRRTERGRHGMTEKKRMLSGELYSPKDKGLAEDFIRAKRLTRLFNNSLAEQSDYRVRLLKELFRKTGENVWIEPPFYCDYGCHISVGENFYANYCLLYTSRCV